MSDCRLRELSFEALSEQAEQIPDDLKHITEHVLSSLIIMRALGRDFWSRELCTGGERTTDFFQTRSEIRSLYLADLIWRLREKPGFAHILHKNGDSSFESTFFELVAADMISTSSKGIEFVTPSGVKGADYDLRAYDFLGYAEVAAEFKCRRSVFHSPNNLRNFLRNVRPQLPKNGNGVVFCKIARSGHFGTQAEITNLVAQWIRSSTSRVQTVFLCWDPLESEQLALGFAYCAVNASGPVNYTLGSASQGQINQISFLNEIGYVMPVDDRIVRPMIHRAGAGVAVELGTWGSQAKTWWQPTSR